MIIDVERFSGPDELPAVRAMLVTLGICVVLILTVPPTWSWWLLGPSALLTIGAATGSRYQVRLVFRRLWVVPVKRFRYLLDASADFYESPIDFQPIGLCIQPCIWTPETNPQCFRRGWPAPELARIRDEIQAAILRARARVETARRELRGPLASFAGALELDTNTHGGRILSARTTAPIELGGVRIPEASTFEFNDTEEWFDPRRDDTLRSVTISRPTWVPGCRQELRAGTHLSFDDALTHVCHVSHMGQVEIDGFVCAGCWGITFGLDDELTNFTLAAPFTSPTCTLPVDTYFTGSRRREGDHFWAVKIYASVSLPGVGLRLGDTLFLDAELSPVAFSRHKGSIRVGDQELECGVVAIPLTAEGQVDLIACEQRGVPMKPC